MSLNKVLTDSMLQIVLVLFKLTSLNDFPLQEGPVSQTGEFKQSRDRFYVTDNPLSVTNIAEMALFFLN